MRIGHGFDAHRFSDGEEVVLGGVHIKFHKGLAAHSDGDVLLHAICDALLFHMQSPRLSYKRVVALQPYEWEWLVQQEAIQALLSTAGQPALPGQ